MPKVKDSPKTFRFRDESFQSLGIITLPLPTPDGVRHIMVEFDIVLVDVPAFLGLDVLDCEKIVADTVFNRLSNRIGCNIGDGNMGYMDEWFITLFRASIGHFDVIVIRGISTHFTRVQLQKIHRKLFHLSVDKMFNLLLKTRPEDATPETIEIMEDISKRYDHCQRIRPALVRFRVSLGTENAQFNELILIVIMYIVLMPIVPIVD